MASPIRVLCVDDDSSGLDIVSTALESEEGITVAVETDPNEAVCRVETESVDCVVSDYQMPETNGLDLLEAVRDVAPKLPFIVFTAVGNEAVASEAISAGVTDYVRKPSGTEQYALLANRVRNAVEQYRAMASYREVFHAVSDGIVVADPDTGTIVDANHSACEQWGYDPSEMEALSLDDLVFEGALESITDRIHDGSSVFDVTCETNGGRRFVAEVSLERAVVEGQNRVLAIVRDVTERRDREHVLAELLVAERNLLTAHTTEEIEEIAVNLAENVLGVREATIRLGDRDAPTSIVGSSHTRRFATGDDPGEATASETVSYAEDRTSGENAFRIPIGDRGVLVGTASAGMAEYEMDVAELLATNVAAALERAEREELLRKLEYDLERQRDELESVNHVNEVIRDINQSLVRTTTRDEIERVVCERFAAADPYIFAWIGEHDLVERRVTPRTWAGVEEGYIDGYEIPIDGSSPEAEVVTSVVERREIRVIQRIGPDTVSEERYEQARDRGYRSVAFIPIAHRGSLYDVLAVYAERPNAFGKVERAVFEELGETIGYALHASEQRRALIADGVTELEFELEGEASFFVGLSAVADCRVDLEGMLVNSDGTLRVFVTTRGVASETVIEHGRETDIVERIDVLTDDGEQTLYEVVMYRSPLIDYLADHAATLRTAHAEKGIGRLVVELPTDADPHRLVQLLEEPHENVELLAEHERTHRPRTGREFRETLESKLTDRQHEVLQAAYHGGFFEWPRQNSGEELAAGLGITQPTFHEHLRAGERKLFTAFFDESRSVYS